MSKHIDSPPSLDGSESERKVGLYDDNVETSVVHDFSAEEERALLRKIDWHVLPLLIAAYLIKNIDGNAISYVKIMNKGEPGNILTMLDITTDQFTWTATVFTIPFMLAEIPSNLLFKVSGPRAHFTRIIVGWSIACACGAASKNLAGLLVSRFFLGLLESGLYPGILALLPFWYRADELAVRFVVLGVLGSFSGIIVAVLAWGLTFIDGRGMAGWQWMFTITGVVGLIIAAAIWFWLPGFPSEAKFLTEREREFVQARLSSNAPRGDDPNFDRSAIIRALRSPQLWLFTAMQTFQNIGTYGLSFWLPSIIAAFGFTTTQSSQLLNIPPAAVAVISGIFFAYLSDRTTRIPRPLYMLAAGLVVISSFLVLALVKDKPTLYAMTLLAGIANNAYYAVLMPWRTQSLRGSSEATFAFAFQNGIAQVGGIIGPQVFRAKYAPNYRIPFAVCMAFQALGFFAVLTGWWVTRSVERETREVAEVRRKEKKETGRVSVRQVELQ